MNASEMRLDRVVVVSSALDDDTRFAQRVGDFPVQQFIAEARIEAQVLDL